MDVHNNKCSRESITKVLLWGAGDDYLKRRQLLEYEISKNNMECVGLCSKDKYSAFVDGIKVLDVKDLAAVEFEYILVFSDKFFTQIKNEIIKEGYDGKIVLDSCILEIPRFDFKRYICLLENPVTIVTQDCAAAILYSNLHLPFSSPFILTAIEQTEYYKLLQNYNYYMNSALMCERESNCYREQYCVGYLGNGKNKVIVKLFHYRDFEAANSAWERRKARINKNNQIFLYCIHNEKELEEYKELSVDGRKIGFVTDPLFADNITSYYMPRYTWRTIFECDMHGNSLNEYIRNTKYFTHSVDVLKMLTGHKDFLCEM